MLKHSFQLFIFSVALALGPMAQASTLFYNSDWNFIRANGDVEVDWEDLKALSSEVPSLTYEEIGDLTIFKLDGSINKDNFSFTQGKVVFDPAKYRFIQINSGDFVSFQFKDTEVDFGVKQENNGKPLYSSGIIAEIYGEPADNYRTNFLGSFYFEDGNTVNFYGGEVWSEKPFGFGTINGLKNFETLNIEQFKFVGLHEFADMRFDIDPASTNLSVSNGLVITNLVGTTNVNFSGAGIPGFAPTLENATLETVNTQSYDMDWENIVFANNYADQDINLPYVDYAENPKVTLTGADKGSGLNIAYSYNNPAFLYLRKKINVALKDTESNSLEAVKVYVPTNPIVDNKNEYIYEATTNSEGRLDNDLNILYATYRENYTAAHYTSDDYLQRLASGEITENGGWQRYTKGNEENTLNDSGIEDLLDVYFASYKHLFTQLEINLQGTGTLEVSNLLFTDSSISESNSAVVSTYTELETPQKLYDYAKLWLVENYAGETETLVSLEGDTIVSDFNLTLDPNAAAVFTFDGSTITARASTFSGSIQLPSDKAVTLANGADTTGSIQDANGDSSITVSVPSGFDNQIRVFATLSDADTATNALGSGNSFLYQSATYGGQTLWYRLESATGAYIIEAYTLPTETGIYQQNLVATDTEVALSDIQSTTSKLDTTLSDNGGIYQFTAQALENAPTSNEGDSSAGGGLTAEQDQTLNDIYALLQTVQGLVLDLFSWGD